MKKYHKIDRNKLYLLRNTLNDISEEFTAICLTPLQEKNEIEKDFELRDLDKEESFVLMQMVKEKGLLKPGWN